MLSVSGSNFPSPPPILKVLKSKQYTLLCISMH
nr:MAG TPA: hypothetical protein [Caudoviricetes sp.]DAW02430.1 MAG TPA: hypothetical protein [Caudoviricetes sp.]DAY64434.1 MAG TPA: hypothetical protein [Caudoviricetes sp.]